MTEMLDSLIVEITTLEGPTAIVAFIIMFGYSLKMWPGFPNRFIPLVSFCIGPLLSPLMIGWPSPGTMEPNLRWPEQAAWVSSLIQGFLLACLAWISHAAVLRRLIDDKIPALNPGRVTEKSESEKTVTDEKGDVSLQQVSEERTTDVKPVPPVGDQPIPPAT